MKHITDFFQLIQLSIGSTDHFEGSLSTDEWRQLFEMSKKQSLAGICFEGIQKLSADQFHDEDLTMDWMGESMKIARRNVKVNAVCKALPAEFTKRGFNYCILKGQSNHLYYPKELASQRMPGDVDIWAWPKEGKAQRVKRTMLWLEKTGKIRSLAYLHAEMEPVNSVPVEVHFRPTFLNEPIHNHRLQEWFWEHCNDGVMAAKTADGLEVSMLKPVYNIIFQLVHIYRHLLDEGIGLRQLLDYYFLLTGTVNDLTDNERQKIRRCLSSFGLNRITGAVMYVLQKVFAMDSKHLITDVDEKYGRQLLDEILIAGNFGHYDPRLKDIGEASHKTSYQVRHAMRRFTRNTRFFRAYPSEVICEPFARVIHFWWRKFKLWRY